jgi:hypothetical protein
VKLPGKIVLLILLAALSLAGCSSAKKNSAGGSASSAVASAASAIPSADISAGKAIIAKCIPVNSAASQILFFGNLAKDTQDHPNGSRHELSLCFGIPKDKRPAFEAAVLDAAEKAALQRHVKVKDKVKRFMYVTLPGLILKYKGKS